MPAVRLQPGQKYFLRYRAYHHDPQPYLWVLWADRNYVQGFNIHYLPYIRFKVPVDRFRRVNEADFQKRYDAMIESGFFVPFNAFLEKVSKQKISKSRASSIREYVERRFPWSMEAFRKYHTNLLVLREEPNLGEPTA
jgi:hypothetical protein